MLAPRLRFIFVLQETNPLFELSNPGQEFCGKAYFVIKEQAANWTIAQRNKYFSIMERCDKETLLQRHNSKDCIRKKKEYMVKKSNNVLVVGNSKSGGIGKIVAFARTLGKTVILIDLNPFEVGTDF